jgi:hypothetical protein
VPERIQLRRTKGWRMPENTVSVARPSKWGNPFMIGRHADTAREVVTMFRDWMKAPYQVKQPDPTELRGKNLACWCKPDQPCHADVLLELANQP